MLRAKWHVPLLVMNFFFWRNCPGTIDSVKFLECRLGPNTESANVTTRSNFQQIQAVHIDQRNARYVAESPTDAVVLWVDDYWTTALNTSAVSHFTDTSTETSRILYLHMCKFVNILQVLTTDANCGSFTPWSNSLHITVYSSIPMVWYQNTYNIYHTWKYVHPNRYGTISSVYIIMSSLYSWQVRRQSAIWLTRYQ